MCQIALGVILSPQILPTRTFPPVLAGSQPCIGKDYFSGPDSIFGNAG
jgi:hypothetical protein